MKPSNKSDILFYADNEYRFSVRCCVFLKNDKGDFLVQKKKSDALDSWALPGGKLKIGEKTINCVIREIKEEFGVNTFNHHFLGVIEQDLFISDQRIHEHNYIYSATFLGDIILHDETLEWKWLSMCEIHTIKPKNCSLLLNNTSSMISNGF